MIWFPHLFVRPFSASWLSTAKDEAHPTCLGCISVLLHRSDPHAYMRTVILLPFVLCLQWIPLCLLPLNNDWGFFLCLCARVCEGERLKENSKRAKATRGGWLCVFTNPPPVKLLFFITFWYVSVRRLYMCFIMCSLWMLCNISQVLRLYQAQSSS